MAKTVLRSPFSTGCQARICSERVAEGDQGMPTGFCIWTSHLDIFQNDLTYTVDANMNMYADDHQYYAVGSTLSDVHVVLSQHLHGK